MKNKIKNTEMEYIAKASCGVDSSFPTDRYRRVIDFYYSVTVITCGRRSQVSEDFSKHTKEVVLLQLARYI